MIIQPCRIEGKIRANASKSCLQRALVLSALASGKSQLFHCDESEDVKTVKSALISLGAEISGVETIDISPLSLKLNSEVDISAGESGLALRMLAPVVSLFSSPVTIHGEGSLPGRPLKPLLDMLREAGIDYDCTNDQLPLKIKGPIRNHRLKIDGSFSSQMLTGLLITLPLLSSDSVIQVHNPVSMSYIDLTLEVMNQFGVKVSHENYRNFNLKGNQQYTGTQYTIEGDWSGAANFLVAASISGEVTVNGLDIASMQADKQIINALNDFGADWYFSKNCIKVRGNQKIPFAFDATHCPDLVPPLVVLAAAAQGESTISGIHRLVHKESNRVESIVGMMQSLGGEVIVSNDTMIVRGRGVLSGGVVDSRNDHRIAMAAAVAACISEAPVHILHSSVVRKSYPQFFEKLNSVFATS